MRDRCEMGAMGTMGAMGATGAGGVRDGCGMGAGWVQGGGCGRGQGSGSKNHSMCFAKVNQRDSHCINIVIARGEGRAGVGCWSGC